MAEQLPGSAGQERGTGGGDSHPAIPAGGERQTDYGNRETSTRSCCNEQGEYDIETAGSARSADETIVYRLIAISTDMQDKELEEKVLAKLWQEVSEIVVQMDGMSTYADARRDSGFGVQL
jgi:hypothetical protein